jgi:hypothetical protein
VLCTRIVAGRIAVVGNRSFERERIAPATRFFSRDVVPQALHLIHQEVEPVLYFFETVFFTSQGFLSVRYAETRASDVNKQNWCHQLITIPFVIRDWDGGWSLRNHHSRIPNRYSQAARSTATGE